MLKQYHRPTLIEYGRIDAVTTGSSGGTPDYISGTTTLVPGAPGCQGGPGIIYCAYVGSV